MHFVIQRNQDFVFIFPSKNKTFDLFRLVKSIEKSTAVFVFPNKVNCVFVFHLNDVKMFFFKEKELAETQPEILFLLGKNAQKQKYTFTFNNFLKS